MSQSFHEPPSLSLEQQSAQVLEWGRVLDALAGQARSTLGAARCRGLSPESDLAAADTRLRETAEMVALRHSDDPFPSLQFSDVREALGRCAKGASLEPHELRDVSFLIGLGLDVVRYLARQRDAVPTLLVAARALDGVHEVHKTKVAIDRAIDPEANVRESATPELRRLMHYAQDLKLSMRHRLDAMLASTRYEDVLQEKYFAQREGRYVVPVKAELRSRIPGIVHDVSASGATVFLEPRELVDLNNSIKVAELEVNREVARILQELSASVGTHAGALDEALRALADLDCIHAKAAFSGLVRGQAVSLNDRGRIVLKQARHPLLVLAKAQVVANDLCLDERVRVLVISGPNTGGKTVTLKLIGLFALMVRAGLQPPCGEGSDMAFFESVFADIGDAQDLAKDLSSFSAHMTQMVRLLDQIGGNRSEAKGHDSRGKALVLLDEPVTSTDPEEGEALAEALLIRLRDLGMTVVATTHYHSLKALAQTTEGFMNASVEFDVSTLSPTYRVFMGIPGGSSAIEIAGRLGMDESILDHALGLVKQEDRTVEQMLEDLHEKQRRLADEVERASAMRVEAERAAREATEIEERLRATERDERKRVKTRVTEELLRVRAQVQSVMDELKADRTIVKAKAAKQRLADIEQAAQRTLDDSVETAPLDRLATGDAVELVGLGKIGTLVEPPQDKKRVRVRVGETEVSVARSGLRGLARGSAGTSSPDHARQRAPRDRVRASSEEIGMTAVLDLRGKPADEALDQTVAALDRAALSESPRLRIIHGHGTGRLKTVIRDYLRSSPYVATFRQGDRSEGGDGVTIVELR